MADKATLKLETRRFRQHAGNCGFVDLSMHMLNNIATYRARLRSIEEAMLGIGAFPAIPAKYFHIHQAQLTSRVAKRMHLYEAQENGMVRYQHNVNYTAITHWLGGAATRLNLKANNNYDIALVYALSIAFKAALKQSPQAAVRRVWEECEDFSKAIINTMRQRHYRDEMGNDKPEKWEYGRKLKNINENALFSKPRPRGFGDGDEEYSYKHGDLGLTINAMKEFIQFTLDVDPDNLHYKQIVNFVDLEMMHSPEQGGFWPQFQPFLEGLRADVNSVGFRGAVVAMAYKPDLAPLLIPYNHICHWVYIPTQAPAIGVNNIQLWTWGKNRTLQTWYTGIAPQNALSTQRMIPHGYYLLP